MQIIILFYQEMNSNPLNLDWPTKPLTALFNGNLSQEIFNNNSSCVTPVTFHLPEAMQHNFALKTYIHSS